MIKDIFFFPISTDEDLSYVLEFSGIDLSGRSFQVLIKDRASGTTRATLTNGSGIAITGTNVLEVVYAKGGMASWPRGEYTADVVDITGGANGRIMAVRFLRDLPGRLVGGVKDRKAFVTWVDNTALITATGAIGPAGPSIADGDKGDIVVSGGGTVWSIDANSAAINQLQDLAGARKMTGNHVIEKTAPAVTLIYPGIMTINAIVTNTGALRFDDVVGAKSLLQINPDGSLQSYLYGDIGTYFIKDMRMIGGGDASIPSPGWVGGNSGEIITGLHFSASGVADLVRYRYLQYLRGSTWYTVPTV